MVVRVIVRMVVVMIMAMVVSMIVPVHPPMAVRASFRLERRTHGLNAGSEALHHVRNDVVVAYAELPWEELGGQVPIAQMPSHPEQKERVVAGDLQEVLIGTSDLDEAPILELQAVPVCERFRLRQIEKEREPSFALHRDTTSMPVVVVQADPVDGVARPGSGGDDPDSSGKWCSGHGMRTPLDTVHEGPVERGQNRK